MKRGSKQAPPSTSHRDSGPAKTLIIIPARNEEANIGRVLDELNALGLGYDILVINDASTDRTGQVLRDHQQKTLVLRSCLGYGGAVQTGFLYALRSGYDYVVQMDGDAQHDPRSIPALLDAIERGDTDVALGSRFLGEVSYRVPPLRRLGMRLFGAVTGVLIGQRITDPTSGFQALRREVLQYYAGDAYPMDYPDSDVLLALHFEGFRIREVPVGMRPRSTGESIHSGGFQTIYYLSKMCLAIPMVLLRHVTGRRYSRSGEKVA